MLNGEDPVAPILSANVNRRHLSKGQRAMAVAAACSDSEQPLRQAAAIGGVTRTRLRLAAVVAKNTPELVAPVLAGTMGLAGC